jgi:hypothetical protein
VGDNRDRGGATCGKSGGTRAYGKVVNNLGECDGALDREEKNKKEDKC